MKEYKESFKVAKEDCISDINESLPSLLGTYTIVKWMEIVSARCVNSEIEHSGMIKLGEEVEIVTKIKEENKREVIFQVSAILNGKEVATALHKRILIPTKVINKILRGSNV